MSDYKIYWDGPFYEDFNIGDKIKSGGARTFSFEDNILVSAHTGDRTPIYLSQEIAKEKGFKGVVIHPIFVMQTVVSLAVRDTSINSIAFLGAEYQKVLRMTYPGDTIKTETEVIMKRDSKSHPEAGVVTWIHRGINQNGEVVIEVKRTNLVAKKNRGV